MSVKRQATTELNHENWDQEDPSEHEESGTFTTAPKDVLEKRVIRTAKRRAHLSAGSDVNKSVFSGFGGFNKTQPSSFDFLSKLTNGSKTSDLADTKSPTAGSSSLFSSKPAISSPSSLFTIPASSTPTTKTTFGLPTSQTQTFGGPQSNSAPVSSLFTASKADSTVADTPFKTQTTSSSSEMKNSVFTAKTTVVNFGSPTSQVSSTIFGLPTTTSNTNSLFSTTTTSSTFKIPSVSSTTTFGKASNIPKDSKEVEKTKEEDKKIVYYSKLKGLNESVLDWIKKHVEETPLCILSPIFKDYEKYLSEMQEEYHGETTKEEKVSDINVTPPGSMSGNIPKTTSLFASKSKNELSLTEDAKPTSNSVSDKKPLSFAATNSNKFSTAAATNAGFSFGVNTSSQGFTSTNTTSPFSLIGNKTTTSSEAPPFSFGIEKPFSFNTNTVQKLDKPKNQGNEEEEEPPKVEFTPVVEENSLFDKRCKVFVKKDENFVDKGVGTLYIKKVEDSKKHQLLVRANTNLGNVLLNLILSSAIPLQRMGKNNVMMVCIPTPESKPPPIPILIRVKTAEEADELLETLNKFKG